jgi:hypothetical protein
MPIYVFGESEKRIKKACNMLYARRICTAANPYWHPPAIQRSPLLFSARRMATNPVRCISRNTLNANRKWRTGEDNLTDIDSSRVGSQPEKPLSAM